MHKLLKGNLQQVRRSLLLKGNLQRVRRLLKGNLQQLCALGSNPCLLKE